jgi:hypothetical protein
MILAPAARSKSARPQPSAGSTSEHAPRSSAAASAFRVAAAVLLAVAVVGHRGRVDYPLRVEVVGVGQASVTATAPRSIGPSSTAAAMGYSPAARRKAPATPGPIWRLVPAALTIASTDRAAMSPG